MNAQYAFFVGWMRIPTSYIIFKKGFIRIIKRSRQILLHGHSHVYENNYLPEAGINSFTIRERSHIQKQMDSETDLSRFSDYDGFANEIPFVGNVMQLFQFYPVFTELC